MAMTPTSRSKDYGRRGAAVATTTALAALTTMRDGEIRRVTADTFDYQYDLNATSGGDVTPDSGVGRWFILSAAAPGKVPDSRTIASGDGVSGGGDLSANRTLAVDLHATPGLEISGAKLKVKADTGITVGAGGVAPDFGTGAGKVTEGTHLADTANPHSVTHTQAGADAAGAAAAVAGDLTTHEGLTNNPHSVTAAQASAAGAPGSTTENNLPQWDSTNDLLKDGLGLVTTVGDPGADTSVPSEQGVREGLNAKITTPGSEAQGDVLYYNGSAWARLAAGNDGEFLKTQGAAANPLWAEAGGGGAEALGCDYRHMTTKPSFQLTYAADPTDSGADGPLYIIEGADGAATTYGRLESNSNGGSGAPTWGSNGTIMGNACEFRIWVEHNASPSGVQVYSNEGSSYRLECVSPTGTDTYIAAAPKGANYPLTCLIKVHHSATAANGKPVYWNDDGGGNSCLVMATTDQGLHNIPAADMIPTAPWVEIE